MLRISRLLQTFSTSSRGSRPSRPGLETGAEEVRGWKIVVGISPGGGRANARWPLNGRERMRKASSSSSADNWSIFMLGRIQWRRGSFNP